MSLPIDVSTYATYGNISSYLSAVDFSGQNLLKGGAFNSDLPMRLSMVTRLVEWNLNRDPNDTSLVATGNYLYQLCGKYIKQAQLIIANNMPGIIINPANGAQSTLVPVYLQFRVGVTSSPQVVNGVNVTIPNPGDNSVTLPLTYILASLEVTLDGVEVPISDPLQLSFNPIYTNNSATITLANGGIFNYNDLWIISGFQFVAI
jgi:hypothetical protein